MTIEYKIRFYFADASVKPGHGFVNFIKNDTVNTSNNQNYYRGFWPEAALANGDALDQAVGLGVVHNEVNPFNGQTSLQNSHPDKIDFKEVTVSEQQYLAAQSFAESGWLAESDTYNFFTRNCVDFMQAVYEAAGGNGEFVEELWGNEPIASNIGAVTLYADIKYALGIIGDVTEVFWDLVTFPVVGGITILDGIFDVVSDFGGSINDFFVDIFGAGKVTDNVRYFTSPLDASYAIEELDGVINGTAPVTYTDLVSGTKITIGAESQTTTIAGSTYSLKNVLNSIQHAGETMAKFINAQVEGAMEWFAEGGAGSIQVDMANWLANNLEDVINGNLDADEAFVDLAEYIAQQRVSGYIIGSISDVTGAKAALADMFLDAGASGNSFALASAVHTAIAQMAVQFALNSQGWDGEDYSKAGITIISSALAYEFGAQYLGSGAGAAGAAAAAATVVNGLLNSQDYGQTEWIMLGVQTGIAAGSAVAGTIIAEKIVGAAVASGNPYAIAAAAVIAAVIAITGGKVVENIYRGQVFYEGEYGDPSLVLNSVYQVQTIVVNGQNVQALVAVHAGGSTIIAQGITHVLGGSGADVLVGNASLADTISGNDGSDYLEGRGGDDNLLGGNGNDHINGGEGADVLVGEAGDDIIFGEGAEDIIIGGGDDDFAHGGGGVDMISGGEGKDDLLGGAGDDSISGDAGDDTIDGGEGDDSISGGAGRDLILGNLGNDAINGDAGEDRIFGSEGNDTIYGGDDNDYLDGGEGADILNGDQGGDIISGGNGDDFADGGLGEDSILGGAGNDVLLGGMDNDLLSGGDGNDDLQGGFGNDILVAGKGADQMSGGEGNDVYVIGLDAQDVNNVITETDGTDVLLLSWLTEANANTALQLVKDGDDLKVNYAGANLATVTDHFLNAQSAIEKIEISGNKYINLSAVTYNPGTGIGSFSIQALTSGQEVAGLVSTKVNAANQAVQSQELYWNDTYLDRLAQIAYDEQLGAGQNSYYNGTQVVATYRNRGKFGGKYTVYKLDQPGNMVGTDENGSYTGDDMLVGAYWDEIFTGKSGDDVLVANNGNDTLYGDSGEDWLFGGDGNDALNGGTDGDVLMAGAGNDTLNGNAGDDAVIAGDGDDTLYGEDGNDWMDAGDGYDLVYAGNGNDIAYGGAGIDTINGEAGADILHGEEGDDVLNGGDGDDHLIGGEGNDTLNGGAGNDIIDGGGGVSILNGGDGVDRLIFKSAAAGMVIYVTDLFDSQGASVGDTILNFEELGGTDFGDIIYGRSAYTNALYGYGGDDLVYGGTLNDALYGDAGNDTVYGYAGDDYLYGGDGNDILFGGIGADHLDGGNGSDNARYTNAVAAVVVNLLSGTHSGVDAAGDVLSNIENIDGSIYGDTLTGDNANNSFWGDDGDDVIYGNGGDDFISGWIGNNTMYGGDGNDWINGYNNVDSIYGGNGTDVLKGFDGNDILDGGAGADNMDGGNGTDRVSYKSASAAVQVALYNTAYNTGDAVGDVYANIEEFEGSNLNDTIYGSAGDDKLFGAAGSDYMAGWYGNDTISGDAGNDTIYGESGDDILIGGDGADYLHGGDGVDTARYTNSSSAITVNLLTGVHSGGHAAGDTLIAIENIDGSVYGDTLTGDNGNNNIWGDDGDDFIYGNGGNDFISGWVGNNTIYGGDGNDTINGWNGIDTIYGDAGNDTLYGFANNDIIKGGLGADTISGGDGSDVFVFSTTSDSLTSGRDVITDFTHSSDKIQIHSSIASSFSGFSITTSGGNTFVNDTDSSFSFQINGTPTIDNSDFLFV